MIRSFNTNTRNLILRLVTIILVPAIVLTVFYNLYVFRSTYNKFAAVGAEHSAALRLEMDEKLSLINSFLLSEATGNDFATICYTDDMLNRNLSLSSIINHFTQRIQDIPEIAALFILSDSFCRDRYNSYISFGESTSLKAYARSFLTEDTQNQARRTIAWQSCLVGEDSYLTYHYTSHNVHLVCFFSLEQLYQNTLSSQYENRTFILTDSAGNILFSCPAFPFADSLKIPDQETPYYRATTSGRYLYAPAFSEHTDYILFSVAPAGDIISNVTVLQILLLVLSLLLLLTVPLYFYLMNHFFLKPMHQLTQNILELKQQNQTVVALNGQYNIREFALFQETLNGLLAQNAALTREYYQKELESQTVRLQCYRLQLKPHFYLNCLKQVYSLLNQKKYVEAENALFYLAGYLRFVLKDHVSLIPLSGELECLANYVRLRNIGASLPITLDLSIDDSVRDAMIPMMLLEIFLENSVKHGTQPGQPLLLHIEGHCIDDNDCKKVYFCIRDNGPGFRSDVLALYNVPFSTDLQTESLPGVGISNIIQRCHILYHGREFFHFSNGPGAVVEIMIPFEK